MQELLHTLEHTVGVCGEKHVNFIMLLLEYPTYMPIFNYIKSLFK